MVRNMLFFVAISAICGSAGIADDVVHGDARQDDVRQIEQEVADYVEAFNAKNAAALSRHWSENGAYVRPSDGTRLVGREAIQKEFEDTFAQQPEAVLAVKVHTIRFVTGDVAIEEGTAEVTLLPDTNPSRTDYTAVHLKRDGEWQIDSIRETDLPSDAQSWGDSATASGHLDKLAWLVGDWVDRSEDATVETSVKWTKNNSFLSYSFKVSAGTIDELEGTQVVGWDPVGKTIRSWMFDSEGGFGEGLWSRGEDGWRVALRQVLADGRLASSTNVYTPVDENTFFWQSIDRELDGQPLPNVGPVTLIRKPAADSSAAASK